MTLASCMPSRALVEVLLVTSNSDIFWTIVFRILGNLPSLWKERTRLCC